jgi:hypothetical protein
VPLQMKMFFNFSIPGRLISMNNKYWMAGSMETTLNIHIDVLRVITSQARARGVSRSEMMIFLLKKAMDNVSNPGHFGSLVRYQERSRPEDWHAFHIRLRVDEYEYMLDLRKLLKMSVSLILANAVERYLQKSKQTIKAYWEKYKTDKNRYKNYIIMRELVSDVVCWKFWWGFPPHIERHLPD